MGLKLHYTASRGFVSDSWAFLSFLTAFHPLSLLHFPLLHFPPLLSTPDFSTPAFSAPPLRPQCLNLLQAIYLRLRKIVVERVTVVKFGVNNRGSDGTACFGMKVRTDTAEFVDVRIAGHRKWWDLIREGKMFIKNNVQNEWHWVKSWIF